MKNKYKAVIIGAGNMGAFYSKPDNYGAILTHAHAYKKEKRTKLIAFVDIDKKKALRAGRLWRVKAYTDINKMFHQEKPEIVSICTPDEIHKEVLKVCLKYKPKLVFCEKPFTTDIKSGRVLAREYKKARILLAVNYTRRWNKAFINLRKEIRKNRFGKCLNIIGIYNKGILHNGSHLISLLRYFFGEISDMAPLASRIDWKKTDPTLDAFLKFKSGHCAHIISTDSRQYELFEIDILFTKARIQLLDCGNQLVQYEVVQSHRHPDYRALKLVSKKNIRLAPTLLKVIPNLVNSLEGKDDILCSGEDVLETQKVCQQLINQWKD
jgi:predicted dehydrogenase